MSVRLRLVKDLFLEYTKVFLETRHSRVVLVRWCCRPHVYMLLYARTVVRNVDGERS